MSRAARVVLTPFSAAYSVIARARNALYRRGIFPAHSVGAPVISVGNITTGGTGKTPLVEWIARELAGRGLRVCVLTRGYGRKNPNRRVVASDGRWTLNDVEQTGDEAAMLAFNSRGVAVICDADRVAAARWAIENLQSDAFILDDGFQHQHIARDLDIVTIDATNPWGNGLLLPAGTLREPVSGLSRADCLVITRADQSKDTREIELEIGKIASGVTLRSRMVMNSVLPVSCDDAKPLNLFRGSSAEFRSRHFGAFCAIGNAQAFFTQVGQEGYELVYTKSFRDHHYYEQIEIDQITHEAIARGADALITTEKDATKLSTLRFDLPCYRAEIEIEIENDLELKRMIDRVLEPEPTSPSAASHYDS